MQSLYHAYSNDNALPIDRPVAIGKPIEFMLLGSLMIVAVGCILHKHYRVLRLRYHTRRLEQIWELETTKKV
jgi:hypothetical protein